VSLLSFAREKKNTHTSCIEKINDLEGKIT
jgi:hypothetical protein